MTCDVLKNRHETKAFQVWRTCLGSSWWTSDFILLSHVVVPFRWLHLASKGLRNAGKVFRKTRKSIWHVCG